MKVKMLSRNPDNYVRETTKDIQRVPRNLDPASHPLEVPREYLRAINSVKTQRLLAKPFVASLGGHADGVLSLATHPRRVATLLSGASDGEVRVWDLSRRVSVRSVRCHTGAVRGISVHREGESFLTVGDDKTIKQWRIESPEPGESEEPIHTIVGTSPLTSVDSHLSEDLFATSGGAAVVLVWSERRSSPILTLGWGGGGGEGVGSVKFNPSQTNVLGSCVSDRSVILFDIRSKTPIRKVVMEMRSNSLAWNPMMPCSFTVANEDYNLYSWDMRALDCATCVHRGHTAAVLDLSFSPAGSEFASASFDRTLRVFRAGEGHSRDIYHTKRMQHVIAVRWTLDAKFLVSASDEMNLRLWKANAAEKLGVILPRERCSMDYSRSLREKFSEFPALRRISRHRHLPQALYTATKELREMREAQRKREKNRRVHSKPGSVPVVPERRKHIVATLE